jgi:hypothetical protein
MVFVQNEMTKYLGRNFVFFQSWNSWTKNATKSCIANQRKKYPNDCLLVKNPPPAPGSLLARQGGI